MIDVDIEQQLGAFALAVRFAVDAPIVGLFGASGAGKTSVVNAIAGIGKPGRGSISVNGTLLFDSARTHRPAAGQAPRRVTCSRTRSCFRTSTCSETCCTGNGSARQPIASSIRRGSSRCSGSTGCCAAVRSRCQGGERQRVAIGRALLAQPRILLMDEPLVALDAPRKDEVLDYIERLRDDLRIPMVYVSHSRSEIARLADAVVVLDARPLHRRRRR
jgi:molybdate transport system ATP-binding protein